MRFLALVLAAGVLAAVGACGGTVTFPIETDAGDAEASTKDVTRSDAPATDAPPFDCKALLAKIDARRTELKVCCPFCGMEQCGHVTQDICCAFSTTATVTGDFDMMVAQYKQYCQVGCTPNPCPMVPTKQCMPGSNPNQQGTCL